MYNYTIIIIIFLLLVFTSCYYRFFLMQEYGSLYYSTQSVMRKWENNNWEQKILKNDNSENYSSENVFQAALFKKKDNLNVNV